MAMSPQELLKSAEDSLFTVRESFEKMCDHRNTGARISELNEKSRAIAALADLSNLINELKAVVT